MLAMLKPVARFSGKTNRPMVCRPPIVIIRIAQAASTSGQVDGFVEALSSIRSPQGQAALIPRLEGRDRDRTAVDCVKVEHWPGEASRSLLSDLQREIAARPPAA